MTSNPAQAADPDSIADRLFRIMVGLAIVLAAVVTLGGIVNHFAFDDGIPDLDAGDEDSLNNWITVVASAIAALGAALLALVLPARRHWFAVLAAVFALLSLDDLVQLHERIGSNLEGRLDLLPSVIADHIDFVIFAPIFAAGFLITWAVAREAPARAGRFLRVGLILLVAAVVVDLGATITDEIKQDGPAWPHATRIAFEEGLEVSGWILLGGALTTLTCLALFEAGRSPRRQQPSQPTTSRH